MGTPLWADSCRFRQVPGEGDAVLGAGWCRQLPTGAVRGRRLNCWNLVLITAGDGWFAWSGEAPRPVAPGDLILTPPGRRHGYGATSASWCTAWAWFRGPLFDGLARAGFLDPAQPVWHPGLEPRLVQDLHALVTGLIAAQLPDDAWQAAQVHAILARARGLDRGQARRPEPRAVAAARTAIERGSGLATVAGQHGMSADRLRRRFRAATGTTPGRWRVLRRLDRAKELLADGMAVAAVAAALGYRDHRLLCRQFRAVTGQSPGAFRRALLGG